MTCPFALHDPDVWEKSAPHEQFAALRSEKPVYWQEDQGGIKGYWAVTRHEDIATVSRDSELFSSAAETTQIEDFDDVEDSGAKEKVSAMLINLDPPDHTALRQMVNRGFTPRMVKKLEPRIREISERLVKDFVAKGGGDAVEELTAPLPLEIIAELIGAEPEDVPSFYNWSNRLIGFDDPEFTTSPDDGEIAAAEVFMYALEIAADRRASPRDDIMTKLVQADENGKTLDDMQLCMFVVLLMVAGNETTRNTATGGLAALAEHPEQWQMMRDDPSLIRGAVDEILRWVTPVIQFRRTAMRDTELGGQKIAAGDKIVVFYPSGNRDGAVFENPDRFDITRDASDHLSFGGGGAHFCLGSHLAKLELRVLFEVMAEHIESFTTTLEPRILRSNFIGGIKEYRINVTPAT